MSDKSQGGGSPRDPRMDLLDYRPDLAGQVEGPADTPKAIIDQALSIECPDCQVNVFIERNCDDPTGYEFKIAHDETCPWFGAHDRGGAP